MIRRILLFISALILLWAAFCTALPFFFLRFVEKKYEVSIKGGKYPAWIEPRIRMKNAAFVWKGRVELLPSELDIALDMKTWIQSRQWRMDLKGDGARLKFLEDWRRKTGVETVEARTLRLQLDFTSDGISAVHHVELIAPDYKFQILEREKGNA